MSITIISSLYRSEAHLPQFTQHVLTFARAVHQAGVSVHYLPIVNDASSAEKQAINQLAETIKTEKIGTITPNFVGRETLYASWNRGIRLSDTPYFTFWNADDIRDANAFVEGYHALENGANLVDFRFTGVKSIKRLGLFPATVHQLSAMLFDPEQFTRKNGVGPFFMASRALYETVGKFDENFRIAGDMQWAGRTLPHVNFYPAQKVGGFFYIHGDNLSNTGTHREDIEVNIIFMRRGDWHMLQPADPTGLREAWESWGNIEGIKIPNDVVDYLWGDGAVDRWQRYTSERNQADWVRYLRRTLAVRGLAHSEEWAVHQRNRSLRP